MSPKQPENIFVQKGGPLIELQGLTTALSGLESKHVNEASKAFDLMPRLHVFLAQLNA